MLSKPARYIGLEKHDLCCKEIEESSQISSAFIEEEPQFHRENGGKIKTPQNLILGRMKGKVDTIHCF